MSDPEMNRLAAGLHVAWRKYTESFGEPPHGTLQQLRALLCFLPKPLPEPEITRPCRWCDEGYPPILSSVSDQWVHRVLCGNRMGGEMTKEEYQQKFKSNELLTGFGLDTTMHMPCGFCAEPDFLVYRVIESEEALARGAVCKHCGRGMKAIFNHEGGGVSFELVQTCGEDVPEWLPKIRRVDV